MRPGVNIARQMQWSRAAYAGVVSCFTGQFDRAPEMRGSAESMWCRVNAARPASRGASAACMRITTSLSASAPSMSKDY